MRCERESERWWTMSLGASPLAGCSVGAAMDVVEDEQRVAGWEGRVARCADDVCTCGPNAGGTGLRR